VFLSRTIFNGSMTEVTSIAKPTKDTLDFLRKVLEFLDLYGNDQQSCTAYT